MQKQLSAAADEIFRILENLMGEYEAEVSKHQCKLLDITWKTETNAHRTGTLCNQTIFILQELLFYICNGKILFIRNLLGVCLEVN